MKFLYSALRLFPAFSILGSIILGSILRIGPIPLLPTFYLIPVYYWIIFRPQSLPLWSLLGIGLFYDSLLGSTIGFTSLLLLLTWTLGRQVRPLLMPYNFLFIWGVFCLYSLGYTFLYLFLQKGNMIFLGSWAYGVSLYPLIVRLLSFFHYRLRLYA